MAEGVERAEPFLSFHSHSHSWTQVTSGPRGDFPHVGGDLRKTVSLQQKFPDPNR
jgi:hypothetical protein